MSASSHETPVLSLARPGEPAVQANGSSAAMGQSAKPPTIWLNGRVLCCQCPECRSLVSVRAWLMTADCLHCGTSIELTEEQEREARRLLASQPPAAQLPAAPAPLSTKAAAMPAAAEAPLPPAPPPLPRRESTLAKSPPKPSPSKPSPPERKLVAPPLAPARPAARATAETLGTMTLGEAIGQGLLHDLPSWLVSLIVHLALLMLLGLLGDYRTPHEPTIAVSALIGDMHRAGEPGVQDPEMDEVISNMPGQPPEPLTEAQVQAAKAQAAREDAAELQLPATAEPASLPEIDHVLAALSSPAHERMFEGRDPRVRTTMVNREGGTTLTEAAVARGLRWLSKHQNANGSWSLHAFHTAGDCNGQCGGRGQECDMAATAMALLPFLGAGQTHLHGRYSPQVASGLRWLLAHQQPNGDLQGSGIGRMYAHGQATIVLCEAFATTGDEQLRGPAQRAVDFIVAAQHSRGGWRYSPGEEGDTSVVGWQLMALQSARMAQLKVPEATLARAGAYLDSIQLDEHGATYPYQRGGPYSETMTAEALLCRQYLGWPATHTGLQLGASGLVHDHLPSPNAPNIYYWYYATQVMHHLGGPDWQTWNEQIRNTLVNMQEVGGHQAGSWTPQGGAIGNHDTQQGGRLYMTALAICTLEVYYRHLPIYRAIKGVD